MSRIILKFQSPSEINSSERTSESKKKEWSHFEYDGFDNGVLELDVETGCIICEEKNINVPLPQWEVDETKYLMKLKTEDDSGNYTPLDYTFAVSMLGQIVSGSNMAKYLKIIEKLYKDEIQDENI